MPHLALDGRCQVLGREAHARDVVGPPCERLIGRLHQIGDGLEAVWHVHHGQHLVLFQEAGVAAVLQGLVVDGHGVVRGAASWGHLAGDDPREAQGPEVHAVPLVVVLPHQLRVDLRDSVDRGRAHRALVGRVVLGTGGPERSDGRRDENLQVVQPGNLENVLGAAAVHLDGELRVLLPDGAEQRGQVHYVGDAVLEYYPGQPIEGGHICVDHGWTQVYPRQHPARRRQRLLDVRANHVLHAKDLAQVRHQLGSDLPRGARDENSRPLFRAALIADGSTCLHVAAIDLGIEAPSAHSSNRPASGGGADAAQSAPHLRQSLGEDSLSEGAQEKGPQGGMAQQCLLLA
mmetsp:Transcript_99982/g.180396  ORF Transcript_99982/g.180396 Transcript_99982/m.180396 type:complete len:346 (+) Transcript_99982:470-1507(+)